MYKQPIKNHPCDKHMIKSISFPHKSGRFKVADICLGKKKIKLENQEMNFISEFCLVQNFCMVIGTWYRLETNKSETYYSFEETVMPKN